LELFLYLLMGIGLSAAAGFKIFIPLLVISAANLSGHLELSSGFLWIGTQAAFTVFLTASILEVLAYFIPGLDNLLDSIEAPAAFIAGTVITASFIGDMSPLLRIILSIIAGGGTASAVQLSTAAVRGGSTFFTLGKANSSINTLETISSAGISILSLIYPLAVVVLLALLAFLIFRRIYSYFVKRKV